MAGRWRIDRRLRVVAALVAAAVLLVVGGYTVYALVPGSDDLLHPSRSLDCRTPAFQYGWAYEAINYDRASDADLRPVPPVQRDPNWTCGGRPGPAGDVVVTSDGIRLAGWYIPAANGLGPTGPTIVLVPGRSSN